MIEILLPYYRGIFKSRVRPNPIRPFSKFESGVGSGSATLIPYPFVYNVWYSKNSKELDPNLCGNLEPDSAMTQSNGSVSCVELGS